MHQKGMGVSGAPRGCREFCLGMSGGVKVCRGVRGYWGAGRDFWYSGTRRGIEASGGIGGF